MTTTLLRGRALGHILLSVTLMMACSNSSAPQIPDAPAGTGGATSTPPFDGGLDVPPVSHDDGPIASGGVMGMGGNMRADVQIGSGGTTATPGSGGRRATGGAAGTGTGGRTILDAGAEKGVGGVMSTGGTVADGAAGSVSILDAGTGAGGAVVKGTSIRLAGNTILDVNGNTIIARGPEDVMASTEQTKDIQQAAAMGANAMRMLLTLDAANGMTPAGFDSLLAEAVARHLLVWVSLYTWDTDHNHVIADALGGGNFYALTAPTGSGSACSSSLPASCYLAVWSRSWLKDLMDKYRSNVIVDAMQEFIGPDDPSTADARAVWAAAAKVNVQFFRAQGYTNPLEIMANFQGRDLYGIVEHGDAIRAVDTIVVAGTPQTMFGWQAYWGTADGYYPSYQGALLLGKSGGVVTGPDAIHQFASTRAFPIQIGIDNFGGDTNLDYKAEIDQAAADGMSWLWWSWRNGTVECPVSGATCVSYVTTSTNGFKGAKPLSN
jgi:hypothetical protein